MTRGAERFHDYRVRVEYTDGTVNEYEINKDLWHRHVHDALEKDETVEHYVVEIAEI